MLDLKLQDKLPYPEIRKRTKIIGNIEYTLKQSEMGQTYSKDEGQWVDQTLHGVATKERKEVKGTTKQKKARQHIKEGGNHQEQENNRQTTMEDNDGGLHPAVDGQSLGGRRKFSYTSFLEF